MAAKSNQEHIEELLKRVGRLEHKAEVHRRALEPLVGKFALYWLDEHKAPVFGIRLNQSEDVADILVITERLGAIDLKMKKQRYLGEENELKQGKWEPFVLPLPMISALIEAEDKKPGKDETVIDSDANSAMFA